VALSSEFSALRVPQLGVGFEHLLPLAILSSLFQFLKSFDLKSVGLGLASIPFHFGWDLVIWNPKLNESLVDLGVKFDELVEISDEFEEDQP